MVWPAPDAYREAIQCPRICFHDPELMDAQVVPDRQGLPLVSSGMYASVYSLELPGRRVAIRCFNSRVPDQEQRYDEISRQLAQNRLPYTVDFRFIADGIMVDGTRYPMLLMEWVEGESLAGYVENNLGRPEKLIALARQWLQMSSKLRRACIAHGDLQHGNVFICNDAIKLIDYDGMYVPALDGFVSRERGHRNFQHPDRGAQFGPQLDNFSSWIIYSSLLILSIDASLWQATAPHDECLLFAEADFKNTGRSKTLSLLLAHDSAQLRNIGERLKAIIESDVDQIPDLEVSAPLPVEESRGFDDCLALLGLNSGSSMDDISQSAEIFSSVWNPYYYKRDARLVKRAQEKLFQLTAGINHLKALIPQD
jgi:hypothetical protein